MGTNYYHHKAKRCEHCGRGDEPVHIGKSSAGWTFSFRGTEEIRSYQDWLKVLGAGGEIRDEYGDVVSLEDFKTMVERKKNAQLNHTIHCRNDGDKVTRQYAADSLWLDKEGNSFSGREFS